MNERMTKQRLEQYIALKREITFLESKSVPVVSDTVIASANNASFARRVVTVRGYDVAIANKLERRQRRLIAERIAIEDFIDSIAFSHMRMIIVLKYVDGKSWGEIAQMLQGNNTANGVRMSCERFLDKL